VALSRARCSCLCDDVHVRSCVCVCVCVVEQLDPDFWAAALTCKEGDWLCAPAQRQPSPCDPHARTRRLRTHIWWSSHRSVRATTVSSPRREPVKTQWGWHLIMVQGRLTKKKK
jgi:hypothetical protein